MTTSANSKTDRARFVWVRRASAVAMARGGRRRRPVGGTVLSDVRMEGGGPGRPARPGLLLEALLSRH